jgi:hypothetical protein
MVKGNFFPKRSDFEISQRKELALDLDLLIGVVAKKLPG